MTEDRAPGLSASLSITNMPFLMQELRSQLAQVLRDYADERDGAPITPEELRAIAAAFEAGQADETAK